MSLRGVGGVNRRVAVVDTRAVCFSRVLLAVCCMLSVGAAQWSQTRIILPDSLGTIAELYSTVWDSLNDRVFVGGEGGVMAFDCATNERVAVLPTTGMVTGLCYNPTYNKVYFADDATGTLSVVDGATLDVLALVAVGNGPFALCYDEWSNKVYCVGSGGQLAVIDGAMDTVIATLAVAVSSRGLCVDTRDHKVYCASDHGAVSVVDIATDRLITTLTFRGGAGPYTPVCYNPKDNKVYALAKFSGGRGVVVIDCATDLPIDSITTGNGSDLLTLCYNSLHNKVYCGSYYDVTVIDGTTNQVLSIINPGWPCYFGMIYCTRNDRVYVTSLHSVVIAIDGAADTVLSKVTIGGEPTSLCYSSRSDRLYAADPIGDIVGVIDVEADVVVARVRGRELPYALRFVPETGKLYSASNGMDGCVSVIDAATNAVLTRVEVGGTPAALCYNTRMKKLYCANSAGYNVTVIDAAADTVVGTVTAGTQPRALCYNSRDNKVYCANASSSNLTIIDCRNDSALATIRVGTGGYQALCYNSQDSKVYCLSSDGRLTIFDGATDSVTSDYSLGTAGGAICYVPSGNRVYCTARRGSADRVVILDGKTDGIVSEVVAGVNITALCYSAPAGKAYVARRDSAVAVVSVITHGVVKVIPTGILIRQLCYDSLDNSVICADNDSGNVVVIDCVTDSVVATARVGFAPRDMVWNPIQNRVYVANLYSSSISVLWDSVAAAAETLRPRATVVRSVLYLPRLPHSARYSLSSVSGSRVRELHPGVNELGGVAAGVYFLRSESGTITVPVRKVVVTR